MIILDLSCINDAVSEMCLTEVLVHTPKAIKNVKGQPRSTLPDDHNYDAIAKNAMLYLSSTYFINLNPVNNTPKSYTTQLINNYPNILKIKITEESDQVNGILIMYLACKTKSRIMR